MSKDKNQGNKPKEKPLKLKGSMDDILKLSVKKDKSAKHPKPPKK